MAEYESVLKNLEEQLTCSVCLDELNNPKILPCHHYYCAECLKRVGANRDGTLSCPTCRKVCELPERGIDGLPAAFMVEGLKETLSMLNKIPTGQQVACSICETGKAVVHCKECEKNLCKECQGKHDNWQPNAAHTSLTIQEVTAAMAANNNAGAVQVEEEAGEHCHIHPNKQLEIYCNTCSLILCTHCTLGQHKSHDYHLLCDAYRTHLEEINEEMQSMTQARTVLANKQDSITKEGGEVINDIKNIAAKIRNMLNLTEEKLIKEAESVINEKVGAVGDQVKEADVILTKLTECKDLIGHCKDSTHHSQNEAEAIARAMTAINDAKQARVEPLHDELGIKVSKSTAIAEIPNYLRITSNSEATPQLSPNAPITVKFSGISSGCHYRNKAIFGCTLTHAGGDTLVTDVPITAVMCIITPPGNAKPTVLTVVSTKPGHYTLTYTPSSRGLHCIQLRIAGKEVRGGVTKLLVTLPPTHISSPLRTVRGMKEPGGLCIMENGNTLVSDFLGHCVHIYDTRGRKQLSFGSHGNKDGQFNGPQGMGVTVKNTIVVSDFYNHRIQEFTMDGKHIRCIGTKGSGPLQFIEPIGLYVHKETKKVFIADRGNGRVQVLHPDLTFSYMFGSGVGSEKGQFFLNNDLAFDNQGHVYVTDMHNNRIQKYTLEGELVTMIYGKFQKPDGVSVINDLLYISECGFGHVVIVTTLGDFVHRFGGKNSYRRSTSSENGFFYVCVNKGFYVY